MVAGREDVGQALAGDERADRQPAAERLGDGHRVGHDARVLVGPQRAGAPQAALDLVEDERGAVRVAGRARGAQDVVAELVDAALALDRLEQDGGGPLVDGRRDRLGRRLDGDEARHERRERRLLGLLRRRATASRTCGRGSRGARETIVAPRLGLARDLERRLVGLGARVGEVHLAAQRATRPGAGPAAAPARCRRGCRRG